MGLLDGKTAVVTGAGNGIGRATALLFAKEGAKVVVNDVGCARDGNGESTQVADQVVAEIKAQGGEAVASMDTVATREGASHIIQAALDQFGRIDILANIAGILRDKTLLKLEEELWDAVINVHLKGTFLCSQAAAQHMKNQSSGRIINTTSISGLLGNFGQANYSAAKAGIYGLTRTSAIELQRYGITANAIAPIAKTRMTEDLPMFEKIESSLSPDHVAPGYLFFASELSRDITGSILSVAGAKLSVYKMVESSGRFKEANDGVWTAEEIGQNWDGISKL
ncbi:MAG: SDR family NAD(P)-dependent oxidoreductase [Polyangiaceae bacterium]|nr:SDR family NAD(P)-dependent oxidoreductase [Polyangiaceae bacterium]